MVSEGLDMSRHADICCPRTPWDQSGTYARFVGAVTMGVAGRFFVQLFGTTLCDFGAIMRWWLAVCSGSSSAFGYLLPSLARGFLSRVYPFARYPVASTPARLPPAPPFRGWRAGGSWAVEIGMCSDACSEIRLEVVAWTAWLQFRGAVGTYLLPSRAVHHHGGHG